MRRALASWLCVPGFRRVCHCRRPPEGGMRSPARQITYLSVSILKRPSVTLVTTESNVLDLPRLSASDNRASRVLLLLLPLEKIVRMACYQGDFPCTSPRLDFRDSQSMPTVDGSFIASRIFCASLHIPSNVSAEAFGSCSIVGK